MNYSTKVKKSIEKFIKLIGLLVKIKNMYFTGLANRIIPSAYKLIIEIGMQ